jgi:hypothetical protein
MVIVPEGGQAQKYIRCMPSIENGDNENLYKYGWRFSD